MCAVKSQGDYFLKVPCLSNSIAAMLMTHIVPEVVVSKDYSGRALVRWMIAESPRVAVLTNSEGADRVRAGGEPLHAVGFPKSDVYVLPSTGISDGDCPNWAEMTPRF